MPRPEMIMVCGSNGAGKSTLTYSAQKKSPGELPFIDPDKIAKERQATPIETGRIVSTAVKEYIAAKRSFVRESTLTSNFDFQMLQAAQENGFKTSLVYVGIGSADDAVNRVRQRHAKGGHSVPEKDIRRRYARSLENLPKAIRQVDAARVVDNSGEKYREVATFEKGALKTHEFTPAWFKKPLGALTGNTP